MFFLLLAYHLFTFSAVPAIASKLDAYLHACTDLGYFSGSVLVAKEGKIILDKGYGLSNHAWNIPNTPQTKFRLSSLSKPFISLAIMQLQERGLLRVHDLVSDYIPDYPRGNEITIHYLLTHTSGIKNYTALAAFDTFKKLPHSIDEVIEQFKYLGLASNPGAVYKFSNSNYALLSFIIEQVTGQPHYEYIVEHIFKPAGMINSGYDCQETIVGERAVGYTLRGDHLVHAQYHDTSAVVGLGGFYSTVEDMYAFNRALDTDFLVSRKYLDRIFKPYVHIGSVQDGIMYGYGWATITLAGRTVKKHIGGIDGFSTAMYRFVDDGSFIAVLSNFQHSLTEPMSFDLASIMYGEPYLVPIAHQPVVIDTSIYKAYVGEYRYKGLSYTVYQKGKDLYLKNPDKVIHKLIPYSKRDFFVPRLPIAVSFGMGEHGIAVNMVTQAFAKKRLLYRVN